MNIKNIILIILIVVVLAILGVFIFNTATDNGKINTQINFISEDTLKNGQSIEIELKDNKGEAITGQNVTITYQEDGKDQNYSLITDGTGKVYLTLSNEPGGEHEVKATYNGTARYNGCSAEKTITIEDSNIAQNTQATLDNATASTVAYNNVSNSTQNYYDGELNVYYDANGVIVNGDNAGSNIYFLKINPPELDEDDN